MIGVTEIIRRLPHRPPLLLVDRVTEIVPGERLTAVKAVTASEPWFQERLLHDGDVIKASPHVALPSVLLIESWGQAAAMLAAWDAPSPDVHSGYVMLLGSMSGITFLAPVEPGCVVEHHARLARRIGETLIIDGSSDVDGRPVLRVGQIVLAMRPASAIAGPRTVTQDMPDLVRRGS